MSNDLRKQIRDNLNEKETDELVEIWQTNDTDQWSDIALDVVREILEERLGKIPPQRVFMEPPEEEAAVLEPNEDLYIDPQLHELLRRVDSYWQTGQLDSALRDCELAVQMAPDLAFSYNLRGLILDEMGQLERAAADYREAIRLDPKMESAWENLKIVEGEIDEEFQLSSAKHHLDQALAHAYDHETEKALEECELARPAMPGAASAYNYLGLILEELGQWQDSIDVLLKAIQLNPRFYAARENLSYAKLQFEAEQYHLASLGMLEGMPAGNEDGAARESEIVRFPREIEETETPQAENPVPGWLYLDETAYLLTGWPGHRTRPGRSGYDPLDSDFEEAHIEGIVIRSLFLRKFRTRNPVYLLLMTWIGVLNCSPLVFGGLSLLQPDLIPYAILLILLSIPNWVVGLALLVNVGLSLTAGGAGENPNQKTFF